MRLSSNLPYEDLSPENDLIGIYPKANAIRFFLESNIDSLGDNKMVALYGGWGTGKTTIIYYLQKNLPKKQFKTLFFEPWKHELDQNLSLSLLELFSDDIKSSMSADAKLIENFHEVYDKAKKFIRGVVKSTSITLALPGMDNAITIVPKELLDEFESEEEEMSFRKRELQFRKEFQEMENIIANNSNLSKNGKIILFIDDLDRCAPEKMIELLSTIKLFFTYGQRTVFFCGVDKEAVVKAISKKYGDVIKSDEFLEKIYDVSFHMVEGSNIVKLVERSFPWKILVEGLNNKFIADAISDFFRAIGFTTPRHVKKVLNKFEIIRSFKTNTKLFTDTGIDLLIPDIIINETEGNYFDTILVIYVIILFEFDRNLFLSSCDLERKLTEYAKGSFGRLKQEGNTAVKLAALFDDIRSKFGKDNKKIMSTNAIKQEWLQFKSKGIETSQLSGIKTTVFAGLYAKFLPTYTSNNISMNHAQSNEPFIQQFRSDENIKAVNFCNYIENNSAIITDGKVSDYEIDSIFMMAKTLL